MKHTVTKWLEESISLTTIMTQNTLKNDKTWTEKHLKFAIKFRLKGVCQTLWEWLISLSKKSEEIEFNIQEFQEYCKKLRATPHCLKWVRKMFDKLILLRIVSIDKDFGHDSYRINLRHPDLVIPKKRKETNFHYVQVNSNLETSNDCHSKTDSTSSSTPSNSLESIDSTDNGSSDNSNNHSTNEIEDGFHEHKRKLQIIKACAKFGILFNPKKITTHELYKYAFEDITESLELFKKRNDRKTIDNPQGWLIDCLRYKYYEDVSYSPERFLADMKEIFVGYSKDSE